MKTKSLLIAAALSAAGVVTSVAQTVYSVNVVGYMNVTLAPGFNLIANQLNTTNNSIGSLLPNVPPGFQLFKYTPGSGFASQTFDEFDLVWSPNSSVTLNPGEGAFIKNNQSTNVTLTFVGEVLTGNLTNSLVAGFQIASSKLPVSANLTGLGIPAAPGDQVFRYSQGSGYTSSTFDEFDLVWSPANPTINVGEGFFIKKVTGANWVQQYTVQ